MGQTTDKIENYIDSKREDLGSNLQELEQKVKSATDWRQHFQKNPMTMLGVAVGGGILLATMAGGRKKKFRDRNYSGTAMPPESQASASPPSPHKEEALKTWDNIKGALIGVAATRFKDFVGEVVPGFHEQFERTSDKSNAIEIGQHRSLNNL